MPLASGTRLGPYEIAAALGAGGMGEVYRARDTRLGRDVAIKILPKEMSADAARKQRFEREAKTISGLNHPNICTLHDVGSQDGVDYLVMECVEGETLAKRLERGPLPLEQVLKYGAQIADALDKAHRNGVVHRDLKPGNIMLTATGAKLLDFGLAKPAAPLVSGATLTAAAQSTPVTQEGTIVGTFQYMSPEQVEGKDVDGRSDIFSLGAVLYEMLTGQRAFPGKSHLSVTSAILEKEPAPLSTIKPMTPPVLGHAIRRCLAKDPEERWQTARDLKCELEWIVHGAAESGPGPTPSARRRKTLIVYAGFVTAAALAFAGLLWHVSVKTGPRPSVVRFMLTLPASEPLVVSRGPALAFSPDGRRMAYVVRHGDRTALSVRDIGSLESRLLAGTEGALNPFFSPDGDWLGFYADGKLKKIPTAGGPPIILCAAPEGNGATWLPDGTIVFNGDWRQGLARVSSSGGVSEVLTRPDPRGGEDYHWWPDALPGSRAVLFTNQKGASGARGQGSVSVLSLKSREWRTLIDKGNNPHYISSGYIVYERDGAILAAPFDADRLALSGSSFPVLQGVLIDPGFGVVQMAISRAGSVVYIPGTPTKLQNTLVVVDRTGKERLLTSIQQSYEDLTLSPEGRLLALTIRGEPWNVWLYDLRRDTLNRFTFESDNRDPIWSSDGRRLIYISGRQGRFHVLWKPTDASGPEEELIATDAIPWAYSCSRDGRWLSYDEANTVYLLPLVGERKPKAVMSASFAGGGAISPDGKWIAYESNESGQSEVYVQPLLSGVGKWQISTNGGIRPRWSADGHELFFISGSGRDPGQLMSTAVRSEPSFLAGAPRQLFAFHYAQAGHSYAVMPDGQHFICIKESERDIGVTQLNVILNWTEELKK